MTLSKLENSLVLFEVVSFDFQQSMALNLSTEYSVCISGRIWLRITIIAFLVKCLENVR